MVQEVRTLGLEVPDDFPAALFDRIHERVAMACAVHGLTPELRTRFAEAFDGVVYRFLACDNHVESFHRTTRAAYGSLRGRSASEGSLSFSELGGLPLLPRDRYAIERDIYAGWLAALAVHDSLCYALFVIGCAIRPDVFEWVSEPYVYPKRTLRAYADAFPEEGITDALHHALESMEYRRFSAARLALAPGAALGRTTILGRPSFRVGLQRWLLGEELTEILKAMDVFISEKLPVASGGDGPPS